MVIKIRQHNRAIPDFPPTETVIECEYYELVESKKNELVLNCWKHAFPENKLVHSVRLGYDGLSAFFVMERGKTIDHREFDYYDLEHKIHVSGKDKK